MKKLFTILVFSLVTSLCVTSCTEEEVKPNVESINAGRELDPA